MGGKYSLIGIGVLVLATALGCAGKADAADGIAMTPNPTLRTATFKVGPATVTAELALTADQQAKGLMFRKSVPEGKGMLFSFDKDQVLVFWMKNTEAPLSIAWISSDGTIRGLADMKPFSLADISSEYSVRYALEVGKGWFAKVGVKVGDKVELPPLN
ncbi:MAG: DUF192 domain-containing protein [Rectinemataceae bacterium]